MNILKTPVRHHCELSCFVDRYYLKSAESCLSLNSVEGECLEKTTFKLLILILLCIKIEYKQCFMGTIEYVPDVKYYIFVQH